MQITVTPTPPEGWDAFVAQHPDATAYHRAAAVLIGNRAFGLTTSFVAAQDAMGTIAGVLPIVEQSSLLFGRFLGSVPFFTYGGILARDNGVAVELASRAAQLARERRASHLELRHTAPIPGLAFAERLDKVSMVLPLPDSEERLAKQLGSKLRSQIKRAERENPEVAWGGAELLPEFYSVFAAAMHDLGTPVYSRRFFHIAAEAMRDAMSVLVIRLEGRAQAAAIVVRHGDRVEVPWAAASPEAKKTAINMRMYWEMLRYCVGLGARTFDFGRSTVDSGTYRFKAQWGAQPVQLHWHYWLPEGAPIPKLNQSNPRYQLAANLWRRMPLWCANAIGPWLVKSLP